METAEAYNSKTTPDKKGLIKIAGNFMRGRFSPKNVLLMGTSAGLAALLNGCVNLDQPNPNKSTKNNQKVNSQPIIPPSCNPEEFIKTHNYTAPVSTGGSKEDSIPVTIGDEIVAVSGREAGIPDYMFDVVSGIRNKLDQCQEITPEQEKQIKDFNASRQPTGLMVTSEGLVSQNKSLIRNETPTGKINIDPKVLNLMEKTITESGLENVIHGVIVRDLNDPIFKASADSPYGKIISQNGLARSSALIKMDFDSEKNVYVLNIYLANTAIGEQIVRHELGHALDFIRYLRQYPNELSDYINGDGFPDSLFENYYHERFKNYMPAIPSDGLAPFISIFEAQIVMGKSMKLGETLWPNFLASLKAPIDGMTPWYIPKDKLPEAINQLENGIYKDAVEWFIKGLDEETKQGKIRTTGNGFSEETLGKYLMYLYYFNPDKLKAEFPDQFSLIEKETLATEAVSRGEEWAEISALRNSDRNKAFATDPETVTAQERLIKLLNNSNAKQSPVSLTSETTPATSASKQESKIIPAHTVEETKEFMQDLDSKIQEIKGLREERIGEITPSPILDEISNRVKEDLARVEKIQKTDGTYTLDQMSFANYIYYEYSNTPPAKDANFPKPQIIIDPEIEDGEIISQEISSFLDLLPDSGFVGRIFYEKRGDIKKYLDEDLVEDAYAITNKDGPSDIHIRANPEFINRFVPDQVRSDKKWAKKELLETFIHELAHIISPRYKQLTSLAGMISLILKDTRIWNEQNSYDGKIIRPINEEEGDAWLLARLFTNNPNIASTSEMVQKKKDFARDWLSTAFGEPVDLYTLGRRSGITN